MPSDSSDDASPSFFLRNDVELLVLEARRTTIQRLADDPALGDVPDALLEELSDLLRRIAAVRAQGLPGLAVQVRLLHHELRTADLPLSRPEDPLYPLIDTILATTEALADDSRHAP